VIRRAALRIVGNGRRFTQTEIAMTKLSGAALVLAVGLAAGWALAAGRPPEAAATAEPMIGHMVYFQLTDNAPENVEKLVAACDKYLSSHPGQVYYAAGTLAKDLNRPVNDRDWDVALHLVFKTRADYDKYADAERHKQFIEENKANWKKVRVFDSLLAGK
jgi:Stress responsive A/B Barrel Domain